MINIFLHSTIFPSLIKMFFCIFSFSLQRPFSFFPFPPLPPLLHLSQISCESISQQMKLFVYLFGP